MTGQHERLNARRQAITDAAKRLFVRQGYESTSLAQIIEVSGGSLATLYKMFGNKEGVLLAVLADDPSNGLRTIERIASEDLTPHETLMRIGLSMHEKFMRPETLAMMRICIGLSLKDKAWGERLDTALAEPTKQRLAALFSAWQGEGAIPAGDDPVELAEMFLGMIVHEFQLRAIMQRDDISICDAAVCRRVRRFGRAIGMREEPWKTTASVRENASDGT